MCVCVCVCAQAPVCERVRETISATSAPAHPVSPQTTSNTLKRRTHQPTNQPTIHPSIQLTNQPTDGQTLCQWRFRWLMNQLLIWVAVRPVSEASPVCEMFQESGVEIAVVGTVGTCRRKESHAGCEQRRRGAPPCCTVGGPGAVLGRAT